MKLLNIFILLFSCILLSSCQDDDIMPTPTPQQKVEYPDDAYFIIAEDSDASRAQTQSVIKTEFEPGDLVGVFGLENDGTLHTGEPQNACYQVYEGQLLDAQMNPIEKKFKALRISQGQALTKGLPKYVFYYPYRADMTYEKLCSMTHSVTIDQSSTTEDHSDNFEASDLLWSTARTSAGSQSGNRVYLYFDHAMAQITVSVQNNECDVSRGVKLLNMPVTGTGIDLRTEGLGALQYGITSERSDIEMWNYETTHNNNELFRAVVPACYDRHNNTGYVIPAGTNIVQAYEKGNSQPTTYALGGDLTLYPGELYQLSIKIKAPVVNPQEPWKDGKSWVLDVIDPNTGQPVGLLCREYIYWCDGDANYNNFNLNGGDDVVFPEHGLFCINPDPDTTYGGLPINPGYKCINSQAWVLYQLDPRGVPNLHSGQILRVVYDLCPGGGTAGYWNYRHPELRSLGNGRNMGWWPAPHQCIPTMGIVHQGIYTPEHGHEWVPVNGGRQGESSPQENEYYMHGAMLTWDGENNRISDFEMPTQHITNQQAKQWAHVSIPPAGQGQPYVSFSQVDDATLTDQENNAVGILVEHCLVDHRKYQGQTIVNSYPLVKIGFNSFYMQENFRASSFRDGTEIETFNYRTDDRSQWCNSIFELPYGPANQANKPYKRYSGSDILPAGYIFPAINYSALEDGFAADTRVFDPYNEFGGDETLCDANRIPKLYNYDAIRDPRFVPISNETGASYHIITEQDLRRLRRYVGVLWGAKLLKGNYRTIDWNQSGYDGAVMRYLEDVNSALKQGKFFTPDGRLGFYVADISGLNLRSFGMYSPVSDTQNDEINYTEKGGLIANTNMGSEVALWVDHPNPDDYLQIFRFQGHDCWNSNQFEAYFHEHGRYLPTGSYNCEVARSRTFVPVRMVLEFDQRARSSSRSSSFPGPVKPRSQGTHYVGLTRAK